MSRVGVITQARMTSTRLPGKVLMTAGGVTMLAHHVSRLQRAGLAVYVATTTNATDDPIVSTAAELEIPVHRGSEDDVESCGSECDLPNVSGNRRDLSGGRRRDALDGPVEHRLAQVDERHVQSGQFLQQPERIITGTAAHVEQRLCDGRRFRGGLGDEIHREARIDSGRLSRFQV